MYISCDRLRTELPITQAVSWRSSARVPAGPHRASGHSVSCSYTQHPPPPLLLFFEVMLYSLCVDFQNMPNAIRPAAPRPQTFGALRPTANQVPRMMASQRMGESQTQTFYHLYFSSIPDCVCVCSISAPRAAPSQCRSSYSRCTSASGAAVQVHTWSTQHTTTPGHTSTAATGIYTPLLLFVQQCVFQGSE